MYKKLILFLGVGTLSLLSCAPENPKAYLKPMGNKSLTQQGSEVFDPKVDILFVIDNSYSMASHQANLSKNVDKFTSTFINNSIVDYRIGVISTDMVKISGLTPCCGQLVGKVKVVTSSTPFGNEILADNLQIGVDGWHEEKIFDPVMAALIPPNIDQANKGFYRPEATLVLVFLTDAEDQSTKTTAQALYRFLVDLKAGNEKKVLAYGVIVPSNLMDGSCKRDEADVTPQNIETFLSLVKNNQDNIMNICDPDYGTRLATMAMDIVNQVGNTLYLEAIPDLDSIRVTYGNEELPRDYERGWSFDLKKNAIVLGKKINWNSQPSGSRVRVTYKVTTYPQ